MTKEIRKIDTSLEQYFRDNQNRTIDYGLRVEVLPGKVKFYIHPQNLDGPTLDYSVKGNTVECITELMVQG